MSENWRGENHHQWEGGTADYTGKWRSVRREALKRDDYECQRCGKTKEEMGRNPDVHHLIPVRSFDDPQDAHRLLNLVCLCRRCHAIVENNTK
ncbi:HNH endonuclease [Natronomonas gomsonensis]|nr:HNH endonuclease [Natronomonas gomsonensis]